MRQITLKKPVASVSSLGSSVRVVFAATFACFMSAASLSAQGSTNVFNDAVFWFRGGKDIGDDGYLRQQGEFFDDLHANDSTHDYHKMIVPRYSGSYDAFKVNAEFKKEQVVFPALGTSVVEDMQFIHLSNIIVENSDVDYYFPFNVNPRSIFADSNISKEYTIVSRIRLGDLNSSECLFRIGYSDATTNGMWVGFVKHPTYASCKYIKGACSPASGAKVSNYSLDMRIPTNTWVDVAVMVGNGKLRVGVAAPTSYSENYPSLAFAETSMWTDNCELLDEANYSLFCFKPFTAPGKSDQPCFHGDVQQVAIWGRKLSDQEVMEAFGMPRPAIFRTGFDNGSSNEFGGTRSGVTQTIDGLGSWQGIWNTMKAGDTWTVNFNALRDEAGLPQIFSIKSQSDSATALIEPKLNNQSLGELHIAKNGRAFWPVPKDLITAGENTLVIERKNFGGRDFKMDAMELGGSLGVGTISGSSTDDDRTDPELTKTGVPSAADPNPQHWPQELQPYSDSGITNLHLRVWVDPDVADKASFTFKTTVQGASSPEKTMTGKEYFSVYVNNGYITKCTTTASASGLDWSREFQPGALHGGWNDFEFICPGPYQTCHWLFDYFRFETVLPSAFSFPTPPGLSVFIR